MCHWPLSRQKNGYWTGRAPPRTHFMQVLQVQDCRVCNFSHTYVTWIQNPQRTETSCARDGKTARFAQITFPKIKLAVASVHHGNHFLRPRWIKWKYSEKRTTGWFVNTPVLILQRRGTYLLTHFEISLCKMSRESKILCSRPPLHNSLEFSAGPASGGYSSAESAHEGRDRHAQEAAHGLRV